MMQFHDTNVCKYTLSDTHRNQYKTVENCHRTRNMEEGSIDKPVINTELLQETNIEEGTSDYPNINTELLQDTHFKKALQARYRSHCLGRLDWSRILLYSTEIFEILGLILQLFSLQLDNFTLLLEDRKST